MSTIRSAVYNLIISIFISSTCFGEPLIMSYYACLSKDGQSAILPQRKCFNICIEGQCVSSTYTHEPSELAKEEMRKIYSKLQTISEAKVHTPEELKSIFSRAISIHDLEGLMSAKVHLACRSIADDFNRDRIGLKEQIENLSCEAVKRGVDLRYMTSSEALEECNDLEKDLDALYATRRAKEKELTCDEYDYRTGHRARVAN